MIPKIGTDDKIKVNTANADMQAEINELRTRLARLIKGVRRARRGKVSVSDLKL